MRDVLVLTVGAVLGAVVFRALSEPSTCCARVASGVRDRATGALGGWAGPVGDLLGVWRSSPGILDALGVPT